MPSILTQTFQPRPSPKKTVPYSSAALRQDLHRVRCTWDDCQADRDRNAIYGYLSAVFGLVAVWAAEGRETDRARRALRSQRLDVSDREDAFAAIIRCTADPAKADKRTRSKWSRVLRYAAVYKPDSEPLNQFVQRKGTSTTALRGSLGAWGEMVQLGAKAWGSPHHGAPTRCPAAMSSVTPTGRLHILDDCLNLE